MEKKMEHRYEIEFTRIDSHKEVGKKDYIIRVFAILKILTYKLSREPDKSIGELIILERVIKGNKFPQSGKLELTIID